MAEVETLSDLENPCPRRPADCPVEDWLDFLGHRWNALVLWHLQHGAKRYAALMDALPGVSSKVLTERLNGLQERGLILRYTGPAFPRSVEYGLSPKGSELVRILDRIELWSRQN